MRGVLDVVKFFAFGLLGLLAGFAIQIIAGRPIPEEPTKATVIVSGEEDAATEWDLTWRIVIPCPPISNDVSISAAGTVLYRLSAEEYAEACEEKE